MDNQVDASIFVHPDTAISSSVWPDSKAGTIAVLKWGGLTIFLAPGFGDPEVEGIGKACDNLAAAIEAIRAQLPVTVPA